MDRPRMMPLITRPLPSVSRDADAVVLNGQLNFFSRGSGGKGDDRFRCLVTGGILEELAQDKGSPFFVGIDKVVQILHFNPDTALEQQGAVIFDGLGISLKSVTGKGRYPSFSSNRANSSRISGSSYMIIIFCIAYPTSTNCSS